jgi:aspartate aminotransferase
MPNAGYPETRAAIAAQLAQETGVPFTEQHIVMVVGAAGGLNVILKTLLDPGDEVVIFSPYFVEYLFYVENHQGVGKVIPTDSQFNLDLEALDRTLSPRTKVVLINSPNNPSGVVYPATTIRALGELLTRKQAALGTQIYLVSDEPYKKLLFDGLTYPEVYPHYPNSLVVTSHAKDLALPGERIGYIATHPACFEGQEVQDGLSFANRTLGFVNAPALMQHVVAHLQGVTVDVRDYERKRNLLCDHLQAMGYDLVRPQGAFYVFPRTPVADDVAFVRALQEKRILTVPGSGFGTPGYFRIAYCVPERTITNALDGFRAVAREHSL